MSTRLVSRQIRLLLKKSDEDQMDKAAILTPCHNEAQTTGKVIEDAKQALPEAVIYVYNNNSTDDTAVIAENAGAVVRNEHMQGKGNVIKRMFRENDAQCYVMVDGDDTCPMDTARRWSIRFLTTIRIWWPATGSLPHILPRINAHSIIWAIQWSGHLSIACSKVMCVIL
jgi:cellulose synthase/poly-beta-1,6-N-acetylglucosamine synthase-like glycosyltransferase